MDWRCDECKKPESEVGSLIHGRLKNGHDYQLCKNCRPMFDENLNKLLTFEDLTPVNKIVVIQTARNCGKRRKYLEEWIKENPDLLKEPLLESIQLEKIDELRLKNDALYKKYVLGEWGKGGNDE